MKQTSSTTGRDWWPSWCRQMNGFAYATNKHCIWHLQLRSFQMHFGSPHYIEWLWGYEVHQMWTDRLVWVPLTHWGRVTHICVSKLTIIGSYNGLSLRRHRAIIWTNAGILLIRPLGTKFSEILITIHTLSFMKMHLKMASAKWRPFCLCLNVLIRMLHNYWSWILQCMSMCYNL